MRLVPFEFLFAHRASRRRRRPDDGRQMKPFVVPRYLSLVSFCLLSFLSVLSHPSAVVRLERVKGIEPSSSAWKAVALPLSYTRALLTGGLVEGVGFEPT
jgi:hypothetical protein